MVFLPTLAEDSPCLCAGQCTGPPPLQLGTILPLTPRWGPPPRRGGMPWEGDGDPNGAAVLKQPLPSHWQNPPKSQTDGPFFFLKYFLKKKGTTNKTALQIFVDPDQLSFEKHQLAKLRLNCGFSPVNGYFLSANGCCPPSRAPGRVRSRGERVKGPPCPAGGSPLTAAVCRAAGSSPVPGLRHGCPPLPEPLCSSIHFSPMKKVYFQSASSLRPSRGNTGGDCVVPRPASVSYAGTAAWRGQ